MATNTSSRTTQNIFTSLAALAVVLAFVGVLWWGLSSDSQDFPSTNDVKDIVKDAFEERDKSIAISQREADSVNGGSAQQQINDLEERVAELEAENQDPNCLVAVDGGCGSSEDEPKYGVPEPDAFDLEDLNTDPYLVEDPVTGDLYECTDNNGFEECQLIESGQPDIDLSYYCVEERDNPGFETYGYTFVNAGCVDLLNRPFGWFIDEDPYVHEAPLWAEFGEVPSYKLLTSDHGSYGAPGDARHPLHNDALTFNQLEVGMTVCERTERGYEREFEVAEIVMIVSGDLTYSYIGVNQPWETIASFDESLWPVAWSIEDMGILPYQVGFPFEDASAWSISWTTAGPC